jgi:hypothetical protein
MHIFSLASPFGIRACEALAKSSKGQLHTEANPPKQQGPIAVWGQIRGAKQLLEGHTDFYRLDHSYVGRNEFFRMTKGDFQPSRLIERPADRWEKLKSRYSLEIEPWKKGSKIILALSMPATYDYFDIPSWAKQVQQDIKKHSGREVVVRQRKETRPLKEQLKDAHCLVTWASNSVIDALLAGVPVFPLGPSIARPVGLSDLSKLEAPLYPDNREEFFRHMSYCQFKPEDFSSGFATRTADENAEGLRGTETHCSKAA